MPANCDQYLNWTQSTGYSDAVDAQNNPTVIVSSAKNYADGFGALIQTQAVNLTAGQVLATQSIRNIYNQDVASTLSAPINSSSFVYRHKFVTNSDNQHYSGSDFDLRNGEAPVAREAIGRRRDQRVVPAREDVDLVLDVPVGGVVATSDRGERRERHKRHKRPERHDRRERPERHDRNDRRERNDRPDHDGATTEDVASNGGRAAAPDGGSSSAKDSGSA